MNERPSFSGDPSVGCSSQDAIDAETKTPFPFSESLEQIFSILPKQQAAEARKKALRNYVGKEDALSIEIKWADFTDKGDFKSGGASDIAGFSIRYISNQSADLDIARLTDIAKNDDIKAGLMEYCVSENAIIWFLPNLPKSDTGLPKLSLRGLFIPEVIVHEILDIFNDGAFLTSAEKHLVFQLSAGLSLRVAAETDGVAFETKRAQLKAASSKLQCSGQPDLLRHVLGQMTYLLSLCDVQSDHSGEIESFARNFLPIDIKIIVQRLSNGHSIRILERGPANGTPVLVIHGMLWPLLLLGSSDVLKEKNIRMIVPLRSGYLDKYAAEDIYGKSDMVDRSLQDIALYQAECLDNKMPVIGHSYGGILAMEYARLFPDMVSKLVIVAVHSVERTPVNNNFIGKLFGGLQSLSNKPGIFRYLTWQFKKYYADEKTVKPILQKMFQSSTTDSDLIEGKNGTDPIYPWFVELYQKSIPGIADDFKFAIGSPEKILRQVNADCLFLHGGDDPLFEVKIVKRYAATKNNVRVQTIGNAGHHLFNTHADQIWTLAVKHFGMRVD